MSTREPVIVDTNTFIGKAVLRVFCFFNRHTQRIMAGDMPTTTYACFFESESVMKRVRGADEQAAELLEAISTARHFVQEATKDVKAKVLAGRNAKEKVVDLVEYQHVETSELREAAVHEWIEAINNSETIRINEKASYNYNHDSKELTYTLITGHQIKIDLAKAINEEGTFH